MGVQTIPPSQREESWWIDADYILRNLLGENNSIIAQQVREEFSIIGVPADKRREQANVARKEILGVLKMTDQALKDYLDPVQKSAEASHERLWREGMYENLPLEERPAVINKGFQLILSGLLDALAGLTKHGADRKPIDQGELSSIEKLARYAHKQIEILRFEKVKGEENMKPTQKMQTGVLLVRKAISFP